MAKKEQSSLQALKAFKDVAQRGPLTDYSYVNQIILSKNKNGKSVLVIPEKALWDEMMKDEELSKVIKPLNVSDPNEYQLQPLFTYGESLSDEGWLDVDPEVLFSGKVFKITIHGFEYQIPINKNSLPVTLRKAEYTDIKYKVFSSPSYVLALKKYFPYTGVADCGYTMMRLFQIL